MIKWCTLTVGAVSSKAEWPEPEARRDESGDDGALVEGVASRQRAAYPPTTGSEEIYSSPSKVRDTTPEEVGFGVF